jgi:hypothetical protein
VQRPAVGRLSVGRRPSGTAAPESQFDATTGYEKSVSNLSWSYASFLSAVPARTAT